VVIALMAGAAAAAPAQLAVTQPTEKLLVLPLAASAADSAMSVAVMDAVRDRIAQIAKYKVLVVTKKQLCDVLAQSGFPCDGLLDEQQARQLGRHLGVNAYVTGSLTRNGNTLVAHVRVVDVGGSGMAASFTVNNGNPGTAAALAETIAQRLNTIIRASEQVRECTTARQAGRFPRAVAAAQKALGIDPTSAGAHLCISTVYEAQRMPVDSIIAASRRALEGDACNGTAWENIARSWQQKGDTLKAIDAFIGGLGCDKRNAQRRLAIVQLLRQMKQYQKAVDLLDEGLQVTPGEQQMVELKTRICIEGSLYRCAVTGLIAQLEHDSSLGRDTSFLKTGIGAAQQAPDTQALLRFTYVAARNFSSNRSFLKAHAAALESAHMTDSAVKVYTKVIQLDPSDLGSTLLVAKAIIEGAAWDTAVANQLQRSKDTVQLAALRTPFANRLDSALVYLNRVRTAPDTALRLNAYVIQLTGVAKLAQAQVSGDRVYAWVNPLLQDLTPRSPADTVGPRMALRVQASFYFLVPQLQRVAADYRPMTTSKSCARAKEVYDEHQRLKAALVLARRVSPPYVAQLQPTVTQLDQAFVSVKQSFKCRNF
jgi:tetratricopeptide (TPR) repeat protein